MTAETFSARLSRRVRDLDSVVCVGIDPRAESIPASLFESSDRAPAAVARAFVAFSEAVFDATASTAACVKPQAAFFEALGADGAAAFALVCEGARRRGIPVIADVKRGDIGSTAQAYAEGYLAPIGGRPPG